MDFQSLGNGNPFYILRQGEKPILEVGIVKSKSQPRAKFPTQTPNIMQGLQMQQVIDVVATVDGKDETFAEVPTNVEIAQKGNVTFTGSREAMLQAVDTMLQASKKALEQVSYHRSVISESEKMMETLNPQYAENKQQAKSIQDLQLRADAQDKKLDDIYTLLKKMSGAAPKTEESTLKT
jgi:hypothetical protein